MNGQPLIADESATENYSYPWRDNFCEHRASSSGSARRARPPGPGHPAGLLQAALPGANRCEPYLHDVVAVRDGAVLRAAGQEALYLVVNAPNERIRFRYLHMLPRQIDADGLVSGRLVREGEVIGKVGNYFKRERGTTYHLHFDVQVPTKYGWVFVNPYMTLVAAYERLIRGRGQLKEPMLGRTRPSCRCRSHSRAPGAHAAGRPRAGDTAHSARSSHVAKPTETAVESPPTGKTRYRGGAR